MFHWDNNRGNNLGENNMDNRKKDNWKLAVHRKSNKKYGKFHIKMMKVSRRSRFHRIIGIESLQVHNQICKSCSLSLKVRNTKYMLDHKTDKPALIYLHIAHLDKLIGIAYWLSNN